ncbi:MAG: hypothetical protein ACXADX_17950 [Candidatus Hodarchaeales archaeon]
MPELYLILVLSASGLLLIVSIPTLGLLVIRYYQTRVAQIFPIMGLMIMSIIYAFNSSIGATSSEKQIENLHGPVTIIIWVICYVLFALFLAGLTRNSVFCRETALILTLGGIIGGLVWKDGMIHAVQENGVYYFEDDPLISIFFVPFALFIGIWGVKVLQKTHEFAVNEKQERQQRLFGYGLIVIFFVSLLAGAANDLLMDWVPDYHEIGFIIRVMNPILFGIVGFVCLAIIYAINKEPIYLQPQQLYSLMVVQSTGLPLFAFQFKRSESSESPEVDPGLTAGALTAITSFLREAVGGKEAFREIVTEDRIVLAKAGEGFISVLVSERASAFVHLALTRFTTTFTNDYGTHVENFTGNLEDFEGAERVVASTFGME